MKTHQIAFPVTVKRSTPGHGLGAMTFALVLGFGAGRALLGQVTIPDDQLPDQIKCLGECLTYTVTATGPNLPFTYEWRIYTNSTGYSVIEGQTNATIELCGRPVSDHRLRVLVTDSTGQSALSRRFAKMVMVEPLVITNQPSNLSLPVGEPASLSIEATLTTRSIQWYFNDQPMPRMNSTSIAFSSVQLTNDGVYHVVLSNICGVVTSDRFRLTVAPPTTFTQVLTGPLVTDLGSSSGASFGDYDNDGYLDLFVTRYRVNPNTEGPSVLYHNDRNGQFSRVTNSVSPMGVGYPEFNWGDLNNDGYLDLIVLDGTRAVTNFIAFNDGHGSFTKVNIGTDVLWSIGLVDYDADGWLDLHLIGGEQWSHQLYHNQAGLGLTKVLPGEVGGDLLTAPPVWMWSCWADYNNDGRLDLFVATWTNHSAMPLTNYMRCQMFRNEGSGRFVSVTNQVTEDAIYSGMGAWGDYDNDDQVDLLVCASNWGAASTNWRSFLYRNLGGGRFERASIGLSLGWADGMKWGDYNNDGFLDILMTERPGFGCALLHNNGNGTFTRITTGPLVTLETWTYSYTASWFDYDNDGFLDIFVANGTDLGTAQVPNFLHHNNGNSNAWLKIKLVGAASNRDAVGAKVRVKATFTGATRWQRRERTTDSGSILHFGLADATNAEIVRIEWPSGQVTELRDVALRQHLTITEAPGLRTPGLLPGTMPLEITAHPGMNIELRVADEVTDSGTVLMTRPQTSRTDSVTVPDDGRSPRRFYKARVK